MPFSDIVGHDGPKAALQAALRHSRLGHAYLFAGEPSVGKRLAAVRLAQAVNCEHEAAVPTDACGHCRSCHQIEAHTHPDFLWIEPDAEAATPQIKIERIREVEQALIYRPLIGRYKVCLVDEADRLTLSAANALLKTLEEPPAHSLFLLVTSRPLALPATIRSRCQLVRFGPPPQRLVEQILVERRNLSPCEAHLLAMVTECRLGEAMRTDLQSVRKAWTECGSLLTRALQSSPQALAVAEQFSRPDRATEVLPWLARCLRDLLLKEVGADTQLLMSPDPRSELDVLVGRVEPEALLTALEELDTVQRAAHRHLNLQLVLENLLLDLRPPARANARD